MHDTDLSDSEEFFTDYEQPLLAPVVKEIVYRHWEEYKELAGIAVQAEIDNLHRRLHSVRQEVEKLEKLNPDRVNVPLLTKTANRLQKAVESKEDKKAKKRLGSRG